MHRLSALAAIAAVSIVSTDAFAQPYRGCEVGNAEHYERLTSLTKAYMEAMGPNLSQDNYSPSARNDLAEFAEQRIELYRKLQEFIATTDDFAFAIRSCARE